jgi:hypothetical protein
LIWACWTQDLALLGDMRSPTGKLAGIIPNFRQKSTEISHKKAQKAQGKIRHGLTRVGADFWFDRLGDFCQVK